MFNFKLIAITTGISLLTGIIAGGYAGYKYTDNRWIAATEKLKTEAQNTIIQAQAKILTVERENSSIVKKLEISNARTEKKLTEANIELRNLVYRAGGLRDKASGESSGSPLCNTNGVSCNIANSPNSAKLSGELEEFLLSRFAEADELAKDMDLCYKWGQEYNKQRDREIKRKMDR